MGTTEVVHRTPGAGAAMRGEPELPALLTVSDVCARWGISDRQLLNLRKLGVLPEVRLSARVVRFRAEDVLRVERQRSGLLDEERGG